MPVILLTGIPCSGKSTRTKELRQFFEDRGENVIVVSENETIGEAGIDKNTLFLDSSKEKQIRALVKAEANRVISRKDIVIIDAANYIKGYRYELYCMSKLSKTPQCTVHCEISEQGAWERNETNACGYTRQVFDLLAARFEAPDGRCRWDTPLFVGLPNEALPLVEIAAALAAQAPPPNKSTQNTPVQASSFLYDLDRVTQDLVSSVLRGETTLVAEATPAALSRLRRQFLSYATARPREAGDVTTLFTAFLNASLAPA